MFTFYTMQLHVLHFYHPDLSLFSIVTKMHKYSLCYIYSLTFQIDKTKFKIIIIFDDNVFYFPIFPIILI